jgi:hypothetical protein
MAIDNTPPRLKLIVTIAVITVITLIGIDFALRSYYGFMTTQAQQSKLAPTKGLDEHHKAEAAAFAAAALPLDQAMGQVAKGTRAAAVSPQPSDDLGPMTGWSKLPKPAPTPEPAGAAVPPPGHDAVATGDAGALGAPAHAGDAGAPTAARDGGAAAHAPGPHGPAHGGDAGVKGAPQK